MVGKKIFNTIKQSINYKEDTQRLLKECQWSAYFLSILVNAQQNDVKSTFMGEKSDQYFNSLWEENLHNSSRPQTQAVHSFIETTYHGGKICTTVPSLRASLSTVSLRNMML